MTHNFFIGDLGFNKVINDEHPYERATAPFRKEQFDSAPTVGDQSLSGWWTRGQLSFHKGAGVKYYEVLDGETVLDRFYVNRDTTTTEPGEVTLAPLLHQGPVSGVIDMASVSSVGAEQVVALTTDGTNYALKTWAEGDIRTPGTITTVATHAASHLAASPSDVFYVDQGGSSIYRLAYGAATTTLLWGGTQFRFVAYAKNRLWAIDNAGKMYMLATTTGGTVTGTDSFGQLTGVPYPHLYSTDAPGVVFAASPSVVYIGMGRRVWRITVDESGAAPVPSAPIETVILPDGEQVNALGFEAGMLVMGTTAGVRFGAQQGDGSVVYGPPCGPKANRTLQARFGRRIASVGTRVLLGGVWYMETLAGKNGTTDGGVLAFDVANMVDELSPAWSYAFSNPSPNYLAPGVGVLASDYGVLHWDGGSVVYRTREIINQGIFNTLSYASEGYVQTGLHRFGTLDKKHFQAVTVRGSGTGTIEVSKVSGNGVVSPVLGTITMNDSSVEGQFDLGEASPLEAMGLRFTLKTSSESSTPVLLGYQIKALPSPVRQRLIRVPLMMFDIERGPTGRAQGAEKSAWTRYQALEVLEETDALVGFEDKDTGETGSAYIESVELIQRNGSKGRARENGFGGVVSVTLRKVS